MKILLVTGSLLFLLVAGVGAQDDATQERLEQEAYLGLEHAMVEIVEYGAYGCETCRSIYQSNTVLDVTEQYVGAVKYTFRNVMSDHPNDVWAAQGAQCALDQGLDAFWSYHGAVFSLTLLEYDSLLTLEDFATVSADVDSNALLTCLNAGTHIETVEFWSDDNVDLSEGSVFTANDAAVEGYWTLGDTVLNLAQSRIAQDVTLGTLVDSQPIQIVEYGAYGCHACRVVHESNVVQDIMAQYGDRVQFVFRNYPVISPNDPLASEASQCVADQGQDAFWAFHDALYDLTDAQFAGYAAEENYVSLAANLGLDSEALATCLASNTHELTMIVWAQHGQQVGILGTPTFLVNGQRVDPFQLENVVIQALGG